MPKFKYTAKDAAGKTYRGTAEAENEDALYRSLRAEGRYLLRARDASFSLDSKRLTTSETAEFCQSLGTLLGAGVSLVRALSIMANEEHLKPRVREIYLAVLRDTRRGAAFSAALEGRGRAFPTLLISMMKAAEESGGMDKAAKRMAAYYENEHKLNERIKSAAVYPCILAVLVCAAVIFIISFIIPQFAQLFAGMELPAATAALLNASTFVRKHITEILAVIAVCVILAAVILRLPSVGYRIDKIKLRLPKIGALLMTVYTARFAGTLSSLYSSGLSIVQALQLGCGTVGNRYIAAQLPEAIKRVRRGEALSRVLSDIDGFRSKLSASIAVGEETGNLDEMLGVTAAAFNYESEAAVGRMTALLEPALIILMAGIVGFVIIAVMVPIFGTYEQIELS